MLNHYITWNGKSSNEFDFTVTIKKVPNLNRPQRKHSTVSVQGRNGDILSQEDAWENVTQEYILFLSPKDDTPFDVPTAAREIADWLYTGNGYCELSDSYEPDYFRLAHFEGATQITNDLEKFGEATVQFECKPQRFLVSGKEEVQLTTSYKTINNPTNFIANPTIRFNSPNPALRVSKLDLYATQFYSTGGAGGTGGQLLKPSDVCFNDKVVMLGIDHRGAGSSGQALRLTVDPADIQYTINGDTSFTYKGKVATGVITNLIGIGTPIKNKESAQYTLSATVSATCWIEIFSGNKNDNNFSLIANTEVTGGETYVKTFDVEFSDYILFCVGLRQATTMTTVRITNLQLVDGSEPSSTAIGWNSKSALVSNTLTIDNNYNFDNTLLPRKTYTINAIDEYTDVDAETRKVFKGDENKMQNFADFKGFPEVRKTARFKLARGTATMKMNWWTI